MDNVLNIQITVSDEQMKSLLKGKLESLPDEKIQDIFSNALTEFFKTSDGQRLFYDKRYYSDDPTPSKLLVTMVENAVSKDLLKPCVDEMIECLKDKYPELIKNAMVEAFSNMFFTEFREAEFQTQLNKMLQQERYCGTGVIE